MVSVFEYVLGSIFIDLCMHSDVYGLWVYVFRVIAERNTQNGKFEKGSVRYSPSVYKKCSCVALNSNRQFDRNRTLTE